MKLARFLTSDNRSISNKLFSQSVLYLVATLFAACDNDGSLPNPSTILKDSANYTSIQWKDSSYNFGSINFGDSAKHTYECVNTGKKDLYIANALPSCGCTLANYTKVAIPPGKSGFVEAIFDSKKTKGGGNIVKTVIVHTNTTNDQEKYLTLEGNVVNAPNDKVVYPKN